MWARAASCSTVTSSSRWRSIHTGTSETVSPPDRGKGRSMYWA